MYVYILIQEKRNNWEALFSSIVHFQYDKCFSHMTEHLPTITIGESWLHFEKEDIKKTHTTRIMFSIFYELCNINGNIR